jgi:PhzF family phenazine biosynthesis protein
MRYAYRLVNVFTVDGDRYSGNPLCVFEDGIGLTDAQMQALALQFNLSETTFILPGEGASAGLRIFTPAMELPFAGHPTLGSAHVLRDLLGCGNALTLSMKAGVIEVRATGDTWTLAAGAPQVRALDPARAQALPAALGLTDKALAGTPLWVSTGMEQLLVPLASTAEVDAAAPTAALAAYANDFGKVGVYVFSPLGDSQMQVRFFFGKNAGSINEDPATGSACANLGGYALANGSGLPLSRTLSQGAKVGRPSRLVLDVDRDGGIHVGGAVIELGRGYVDI